MGRQLGLCVSTHRDGFILRFDGEEVDVFPNLVDAALARNTAKDALGMLAACLVSPSNTEWKEAS